jgi:D-alanyl-D-alanine carboxypeptidase
VNFVKLFRARCLPAAILSVSLTAASPALAEALLLLEADSGKVLYAENATRPWYPASVTKLMTAYVTLRAVKEGRLSLDTLLTVSANATAQQPSKMGFKPGTTVTVDNALKMLMVKSANDMAVVLAEGVSGSIEKFADAMNAAAQRLGMTQTSYVNPNGLPADQQVTSARDLGILARAMIRELPEYNLYWHVPAIKFGRRIMRNYNTLIDRYPGADGMKTGFICASGFNLVASATRNGRRLIAVVLGAPSSPVRAQKAARLLERGFETTALSWLTPTLGPVEKLTPINAEPPNLRDEMCGKHRKRPAAEEEDSDEQVTTSNGDSEDTRTASIWQAKKGPLLGPLTPSAEPIVVYTGSAQDFAKRKDAPAVASAAAGKKKSTAKEKTAAARNTKKKEASVAADRTANPTAAAAAERKKNAPTMTNADKPPSQVTAPAFAPTSPPAQNPNTFQPAPPAAASVPKL